MTDICSLWAKKADNKDEYHPLICHMVDVAAVCQCLWHEVLKSRFRKRLASTLCLAEDQAGRLISFWVATHDIGKAFPSFQKQCPFAVERLKQNGLMFPLIDNPFPHHGVVTTCVLNELLTQGKHWPKVSTTLARRVATVLGGHHGVFPRALEWIRLSKGVIGDDTWSAVREKLLAALADLLGVTQLALPSNTPEPGHAFFMMLAGLTSVADWIGSAEEYFPFAGTGKVDIKAYFDSTQKKANEALERLGWLGWTGGGNHKSFMNLFGVDPRPLQAKVEAEAPNAADDPSLVLIEAPMGEGKTEAALFLSDYWNSDLDQQGLYVALPTQATSNQMFGRVKKFLENRYPKQKVNLHLLHSHALLSDEYQSLRLNTICDERKISKSATLATVVAEEWFTPKKRGLLAPFAVGTIDQVLLAVLQTRHVFVRLYGLANKTVILDEVHAYDAYMSTLLERLIEWLAALGSSVILLSATLPEAKRRRLLAAYGAKTDVGENVSYPRMFITTHGRTRAFPIQASRSIEISLRHIQRKNFCELLSEALANGGCAVVICNTVGRSQELYRELKKFPPFNKDIEIRLFHAQFTFGKRDEIEKDVLRRFGKEGERPHRAILIATQVVEQSLDLDFDLMVTEYAPIDLVLQRVGRLHRHERTRPQPLGVPQLWILPPDGETEGIPNFGPTEYVYDRYVLLKSYLALMNRHRVHVPADIESLIEAVYGDDGPPPPDSNWQKALEESRTKMIHKLLNDELTAKQYLIRSPLESDDLLQDFCQELEEDNPEVHPKLQALTRLAAPTVNVVCAYQKNGMLMLQPDGAGKLDLDAEPTLEEVRQLLRHSLAISHRAFVSYFLTQPVPPGWRRNPFLRHHRLAVLNEQGQLVIDGYVMRVDAELGAVIEKTDSGGIEP